MIWKAIYKDGREICEYSNGVETNFLSIDTQKLSKFQIIETGNEMMVYFSADNGNFRFGNLDLRKLSNLSGEEALTLVYDKDFQNFKMTSESVKLYNSLVLNENETFNQIEFDETGKFYLNGEEFYLSFTHANQELILLNHDPYEIIHKKQAYTDFRGKKNSDVPYKRVDGVDGYFIGYKKVLNLKDMELQFKLSLVLYYEVIHRTVTMFCQLSCNKMIDGKLILHLGKNIHPIPTTLIPHLPPMNFDRMITQL